MTASNRTARRLREPGANHGAPTAYFAAVHDTFLRAGEAAGGFVDHFYIIGGYHVRLRVAGPTLVPQITPALEHLKVPAPHASSALTICLWDSVSTGATPPPPVWGEGDLPAGGEVPGYNDERISTTFMIGSGTLSMLDRESDLALFWVPDAQTLPGYEIAAPLRTILHWWMGDHARRMVHAGAVGTLSGGVLLAGRGGVGKSTTALSCLLSGLLYLGDDYVLLDTEPVAFVHSLYSSGKLHVDQLGWFPQLSPTISEHQLPSEEKMLLLLHDNFDRIRKGLPIRAVLLPRVTGLAQTRLRSASAADSLRALAPSTIFQLPGASRAALQQIKRFVEQVPSYVLELGRDVHQVPRVVSQLLAEPEDSTILAYRRRERES